jgi:phosphatidylglycerophosphatase A
MKESSDELNPIVVTTGVSLSRASRLKTVSDYFAIVFATWGVGFIPLAPGTFGSAVGVGIFLLEEWGIERAAIFARWHGWDSDLLGALIITTMLLIVTTISVVGTWAATRVEKLTGRKDPGIVVVDEVAGQLVTLFFLPFYRAGLPMVVAGFILFRLFDIWKPYPIRKLESLGGGLGIMADDLLAGLYAAVLLSLVTPIYLLFS